jgi:hypothetical protein
MISPVNTLIGRRKQGRQLLPSSMMERIARTMGAPLSLVKFHLQTGAQGPGAAHGRDYEGQEEPLGICEIAQARRHLRLDLSSPVLRLAAPWQFSA